MPKHDPTPDDEFNASIDELNRCGDLVEVSPGELALTEQGKRRAAELVESLNGTEKPSVP